MLERGLSEILKKSPVDRLGQFQELLSELTFNMLIFSNREICVVFNNRPIPVSIVPNMIFCYSPFSAPQDLSSTAPGKGVPPNFCLCVASLGAENGGQSQKR